MKTLHRSIGSLLAATLALPPLPASADVVPPPSMLPDASNAALPGAIENLGLLDTGGNYYKFGTGLYPLYRTATATTANTTNGSPTITVSSAANIAVGDTVNAAFVPDTTYVTNISGTTVTMSANATATGTGTAVTFGYDRFTAGSTLLTNTLGAEFGQFGTAAVGRTTWVNQYWGGVDDPASQSVFGISPYGKFGAAFATRSSDNTGAPSSNTIGLGVLSIADATGSGHNVWGTYSEGHTLSTATVTNYIDKESSIVNGWTPAANDPYGVTAAGLVTNLRLDVGIGSGVTNNATDALEIINNGGAYKAGITVGSTALDTSGGAAAALALAQSQGVFWYSAAGNAAWKLYSTSASGHHAVVLTDTAGLDEASPGLSLQSSSGYYGLALTPSAGTGGLSYIELDGVGAGNNPFVELSRARGTVGALSAVQNGDKLWQWLSSAYNGTNFGEPLSIDAYAEENQSIGHAAASLHLRTVGLGDETLADRLAIGKNGGIIVGAPTGGDKGSGTLNAAGGIYDNGGPVAVAHGGTGDTGTAWTSYTPTLSCNSGTLTSASASGVYKTLGKQVWVRIRVVVTTAGTCNIMNATAPIAVDSTALNALQPIACRESASTGFSWQWVAGSLFTRYDNAVALSNGFTFACNGTYEAS